MAGPLAEAIRKEVGFDTEPRVNPDVSSVGVAAVRIAPYNPNRLGLTIINLSANTVFVSPLNDPSSSKGITLGPSGGSITLGWRDDMHLVGWEWFAIATGAASAIFVLEAVAL